MRERYIERKGESRPHRSLQASQTKRAAGLQGVLREDDKLERSRKTSRLYGSDVRPSWLLLTGYKARLVADGGSTSTATRINLRSAHHAAPLRSRLAYTIYSSIGGRRTILKRRGDTFTEARGVLHCVFCTPYIRTHGYTNIAH